MRSLAHACVSTHAHLDGLSERGELPAAHQQCAMLNLVFILEEPAWGRSRRMGSVFIKGAAVAGTHKQARGLEPAHRAAEMRAVHRKDLKLLSGDPSHPAWDVSRRAVPRPRKRIAIRRQLGLVLPIGVDGAERDPRLRRTLTAKTGKDIPDDRGRQQRRGNDIEPRAY